MTIGRAALLEMPPSKSRGSDESAWRALSPSRAGWAVMVHEAQAELGYRFERDLRWLENWSTRQDALRVRQEQGISTA